MLNAEQAIALEVLADALLELGSAVRGCANAFASPAVAEAAPVADPNAIAAAAMSLNNVSEWTLERIEYWRRHDVAPHIWAGFPDWMQQPPAGYRWLVFPIEREDGVPDNSRVLVKAAA